MQVVRGAVDEVSTELIKNDIPVVVEIQFFRPNGTVKRILTRTSDGCEFAWEISAETGRDVKAKIFVIRSQDGSLIEQQQLELDTWSLPGIPEIAIGTGDASFAETHFDADRCPVQTVFWDVRRQEQLSTVDYNCDSCGNVLSAIQRRDGYEEFRIEREYDTKGCLLAESVWYRGEAVRRTTQVFNEYGDPVASTTTEQNGSAHTEELEYEYDARGNWTRKIVRHAQGKDEYRRRVSYLTSDVTEHSPAV
jgi:hypothetical protein